MAIGGYVSSSWQFSRLNNTNTRTSVFDTVNSSASAKLGTTDEVEEEETIDVSSLSASERRLIEAKEMEDFKAEIYAEIEYIVENRNPDVLSASIHITEYAFQKMKDDPEFKDKVLDTIYARCTETGHIAQIHLTMGITDADDTTDWNVVLYIVYPEDDEETLASKQKDADDRAIGSFYSSGCGEPSDGLDFDEIWLEQKEKLEYQETIRQQREFLK